MKKCFCYEDAMHYDCIECDEKCPYRKEMPCFDLSSALKLFYVFIIVSLIIYLI